MAYTQNVNRGYVYFMVMIHPDSEDVSLPDYVKIGFTSDPHVRRSNMSTGLPFDLEVEAMFPGTKDEERALQKRFAHIQARREWFHRTDEMEEFICDIMDADFIIRAHRGQHYEPTLRECMSVENPREFFDAYARGLEILGLPASPSLDRR